MKREEEDLYDARCSWLLSFILGGLVGAGIALLMAPKAGKETREQVKGLAVDAREKAGEYYEQAREKVQTAVEKGKEVVEAKKAELEAAVEKGKEVVEAKKAELEAAVEKGVEKARETIRHMKGEVTE